MFKAKFIAVVLLMCLVISLVSPAYASGLEDKRFRIGLDSILIGHYTDVGPQGEPKSLIGLTFLGVGYRRYLRFIKPFYGYLELGTEAFIIPYLEGGLILAFPFGLELKAGLHLTIKLETVDEEQISIYPLIGIGLGLGLRF